MCSVTTINLEYINFAIEKKNAFISKYNFLIGNLQKILIHTP